MKEVVLITGATGFLGSNIAELLIESNYQVIATIRTRSDLKNCVEFTEIGADSLNIFKLFLFN